MRWFRSALTSCVLWAVLVAPSTAFWQSRDSNYNSNVGTGGYQGPGNIVSGAIAFYSCGRAYNAAYALANSAACDIVDTTTGLAACTMKFDDDGFVNLEAIVCPTSVPIVNVVTFCTVTHVGCSITKMYDQTGNGNHVVQATLANMPALTFSAQNGLPCPAGGASVLLQSAGNITQATPFTTIAVAERTGAFTTTQRIITNGNAVSGSLLFVNSANTVRVFNGVNSNLTANDSLFHALLAVASGSAPLFAADSSANISTGTSGTTSLSSTIDLMAQSSGANALTNGFVCEAGLWPADLNSSYQAMLANMRSAAYGWNF